LISKELPELPFFRAIQPKHVFSGPAAECAKDVNKVIHRFSELLAKTPKNQALASESAERAAPTPWSPLAQTRSVFPLDALMPSDLCTKPVMQRNIGTLRRPAPEHLGVFAKMFDS
jgi:hypothetical protein